MSISSITPGAKPIEEHKRKRLLFLGTLLCALAAIALFNAYQKHRQEQDRLAHLSAEKSVNYIAERLQQIKPEARLAYLLQMTHAESRGLRYAAIDALGDISAHTSAVTVGVQSESTVVDTVETAFEDPSAEVRKRAMEILPELDPERGYRLQLAALQDDDDWIRTAACAQLLVSASHPGTYVDKRAVPFLIKAIDDPTWDVPSLAISLLRKLTGQPWRFSLKDPVSHKQHVLSQWHHWWAGVSAKWPASFRSSILPRRPTRTDPAAAFAVRDLEGRTLSISPEKGKLVLLEFWTFHTSVCRSTVPTMIRLDNVFRHRGLDIISLVEKSDNTEVMRAWIQLHHVEFHQGVSNEQVKIDYGDIGEGDLPVFLLIDRNGRICNCWDGDRDYQTFQMAIEKQLTK